MPEEGVPAPVGESVAAAIGSRWAGFLSVALSLYPLRQEPSPSRALLVFQKLGMSSGKVALAGVRLDLLPQLCHEHRLHRSQPVPDEQVNGSLRTPAQSHKSVFAPVPGAAPVAARDGGIDARLDEPLADLQRRRPAG